MKKWEILSLVICWVVLFLVHTVHAELIVRGTDTLGNRLIYDSDLNITWYDYTNSQNKWQDQIKWASALTVNFGDIIFDDWRLPTALNHDGTSPCAGFNCTANEMGHLFYIELGNKGWYDTSGNPTGCSMGEQYCLTNRGNFRELQPGYYWSGTEDALYTDQAWDFNTKTGRQDREWKDAFSFALAVRPGDALAAPPVAPEPISSILFITGGTLLAGRRYLESAKERKRKRAEA
ncbi:MAG: DUF1566 domain-containing protein [Nitrospirae bacterium]|nr:DUF1566 domain-containing protein [Nitrospirota bacterium]